MPPFSSSDLSTSTHSNVGHRFSATKSMEVSPIRPRRSVTFDDTVKGRMALHINNYTAEEKAACWITAEEQLAMRHELSEDMLELMQNLDKPESNSFSRRGLDRHLPSVSQDRLQMKEEARNVVLEEQEMQINEGSYDPEFIAILYAEASECAQEAAYAVADQDEWDAWMMK